MEQHPRPGSYRVKRKRRIANPGDPARKAVAQMERVRMEAMRKASETGERYRDPYADRFPPGSLRWMTSDEARAKRDPNDPVWQGILHIQNVRIEAMRKASEKGERYRDPYRHVLPPPPESEPE